MGDCYVAVCGLPDPRKDHAVVMSRVARDCVYKMGILTKSLEVELGPDTGDLNIRIGLHRYVIEVRESTPLRRIIVLLVLTNCYPFIYLFSGPVTAGVLRGERARFQLFGGEYNWTGLYCCYYNLIRITNRRVICGIYRYHEYGFPHGKYWYAGPCSNIVRHSCVVAGCRKR